MSRVSPNGGALRSSAFTGAPLLRRGNSVCRPARTNTLSVTAKYRGLNTDLSRVDEFRLHENDVGSASVQVARFTARVTQLTDHLKNNKHDYSTTRGLQKILGKRRRLLQYLYENDRAQFNKCISELKIRFNVALATKRS